MNLFYRKCDVCNNQIPRLQEIGNLYGLKMGVELVCKKCDAKYATVPFFKILGNLYMQLSVFFFWYLAFFYFGDYDGIFIKLLYAFITISFIEFIILILLPLDLKKEE